MSTTDLRLCGLIIGQCFGEINRRVARVLAAKGPLACGPITQLARLPPRQVREALFVLMQHNLVRWSRDDRDGILAAVPAPVVYRLELEQVFLRLAYPVFTALVHAQHGPPAAEAVLQVLKVGRCPSSALDADALRTLLQLGFLEHVDAAASRVDTDPAEPAAAASPSPKKRKAAAESPVKGKRARPSEDAEPGAFVRISLGKFIHAIWHEQLVAYTRRRINDAAGAVVAAALAQSGASAARTVLSSFDVAKGVPAGTPLLVDTDPGRPRGGQPVQQYLEVISQDVAFLVKHGEQAGGQYYIDFAQSVETLLVATLAAYIVGRFGPTSARIFRILLGRRYLEEKVVSKIAMISGKECRERLYALYQAGLLHIQEVPRTADHAPSRTIYLWTVPLDRIRGQTGLNLRKAYANILERIQHERTRHRTLIAKTERSDVAANPALLSTTERSQLLALNNVLGRLEHQLARITGDFLLFAHFKP